MRANWIHRRDRQGLTLIELLVAVTIMLMITAIAIPLVAPSGDERRTRETSRLVTSFFQGARTRAIQTGRPFGVMIEAVNNFPQTAVQLSYAEVQPPYSGDTTTSRVHIVASQASTTMPLAGGVRLFVDHNGAQTGDAGWIGLIRPGDIIKLGYQGAYYAIQPGEPFIDTNGNGAWNSGETFIDIDDDSNYDDATSAIDVNGYITKLPWTLVPLTTTFTPPINTAINAPLNGGIITSLSFTSRYNDANNDNIYDTGEGDGVPFQIFRQPVKTAAPPLTLPEGMVIDLSGSHWGSNVFGPEPFIDANNNKTCDAGETYTDISNNGAIAPATAGAWDVGFRGPFVILFSPGGGLSTVSLRQAPASGTVDGLPGALFSQTPGSTIHLLLGKVENTPATPGLENWRDFSSIWVSIHPQTGLVTGTEVGGDQDGDGVISLAESLFFAERGQSMGGR